MYGNHLGQYVDTTLNMCLEGCPEQNVDFLKKFNLT